MDDEANVVYLKAVENDHVSCFIPIFMVNIAYSFSVVYFVEMGKPNQHQNLGQRLNSTIVLFDMKETNSTSSEHQWKIKSLTRLIWDRGK